MKREFFHLACFKCITYDVKFWLRKWWMKNGANWRQHANVIQCPMFKKKGKKTQLKKLFACNVPTFLIDWLHLDVSSRLNCVKAGLSLVDTRIRIYFRSQKGHLMRFFSYISFFITIANVWGRFRIAYFDSLTGFFSDWFFWVDNLFSFVFKNQINKLKP